MKNSNFARKIRYERELNQLHRKCHEDIMTGRRAPLGDMNDQWENGMDIQRYAGYLSGYGGNIFENALTFCRSAASRLGVYSLVGATLGAVIGHLHPDTTIPQGAIVGLVYGIPLTAASYFISSKIGKYKLSQFEKKKETRKNKLQLEDNLTW